jgi:hypothetical protein
MRRRGRRYAGHGDGAAVGEAAWVPQVRRAPGDSLAPPGLAIRPHRPVAAPKLMLAPPGIPLSIPPFPSPFLSIPLFPSPPPQVARVPCCAGFEARGFPSHRALPSPLIRAQP